MTWEMVPLGGLVTPVARRGPSHDKFTYVDLSSVDATRKQIAAPTVVETATAPSRARQNLHSGDVLVSTVRPNLNGVAVVPLELDGAIGSTGFSVLRPRPDLLDARYLFHWVRTPVFVDSMTRLATGASYPAVTDAIVRSRTIPLPPLPEQRRIAAILDEADALRESVAQSIVRIDQAEDALFHQTLGSSVSDSGKVLSDLTSEFRYGTSAKAGPTGLPVLRIPNVTGRRLDPLDLKTVDLEPSEVGRLALNDRDVLFVRSNGNPDVIGRASAFESLALSQRGDQPWVFASYLIRARLHANVSTRAVVALTRSWVGRRHLRSGAATSAGQYNISIPVLKSMPMFDPTSPGMQDFEQACRELDAASSLAVLRAAAFDALFTSLQHRAFRGEL